MEKFFIKPPTPTADPKVYLDEEGKPLLWSGAFPVPEVGQRIHVTMNEVSKLCLKIEKLAKGKSKTRTARATC